MTNARPGHRAPRQNRQAQAANEFLRQAGVVAPQVSRGIKRILNRKTGDFLAADDVTVLQHAVTHWQKCIDLVRSALADDAEASSAKVLNTWAAADERRF